MKLLPKKQKVNEESQVCEVSIVEEEKVNVSSEKNNDLVNQIINLVLKIFKH